MFDAQCDLAALVYERDQDPDAVLREFAADLNARGFRAVGMVQVGQCADASLSAVLVHTGEVLALAQDATSPAERLPAGPRPATGRGRPGRQRDRCGRRPRDRQPVWQARARRQGICLA